MIEPQPRQVHVDDLINTAVTIGIVLEEDHCQSLHISTLDYPLLLNEQLVLDAHTRYEIFADSGMLILKSTQGEIISTGEHVTLRCKDQHFPQPCLKIHAVTAGRIFHWKTTLDSLFTGEFDICCNANNLQLVNRIDYEQYIACVVASEMSADAPVEFIKAQAIVARSWGRCFLHDKHKDDDYMLCNDDDCQRYQGVTHCTASSIEAVLACQAEYLVDTTGHVLPAFYSKCCGGVSESAEAAFGLRINALDSVVDGQVDGSPLDIDTWVNLNNQQCEKLHCAKPASALNRYLGEVDVEGEYFRWRHRELKADLVTYLNEKTSVKHCTHINAITPLTRGDSGRVLKLAVHYTSYDSIKGTTQEQLYTCTSQYDIRRVLSRSFLYSSAFVVHEEKDAFVFTGAGWGHGVGLCQMGACAQALDKANYADILRTYFPQASIRTCY